MKELSMEEKAKAYDEAIKVANKYKDTHIMFPQIKDEIFPAFKESEDEKIRKELIDYFKENNAALAFRGISNECVIAWLEKQGEQKSIDKVEPKFKEGDWVVYENRVGLIIRMLKEHYIISFDGVEEQVSFTFNDRITRWTIQDAKDGDVLAVENIIFIYKRTLANHIVSYCKLINDVFVSTSDARTCCEGNPYVHPATKEQRSVLVDKIWVAGYTWDSNNMKLKYIGANAVRPEVETWVETLKTSPIPLPKPAWGEEDEKMAESCKNAIVFELTDNARDDELNTDPRFKWLKSLKDRVLSQPKQEWNEDDDAMIDNILGTYKTLEDMLDLTKEQDKDILESMNFERDWIMSLKDRVQPQKQEWSEEDENRFTNLILLVKCSKANDATKEGFIKFINKVKSLKDRYTWYAWKPSEVQVECLSDAIKHYNSLGYHATKLKELLDDLLKLREG